MNQSLISLDINHIQRLIFDFLEMRSIDDLYQKFTQLTEENQQIFIELFLKSLLLKEFPPSFTYQRRFLKLILNFLEKSSFEVNEDLLKYYFDLISQEKLINNGDSTYFRTFFCESSLFPVKSTETYRSFTVKLYQQYNAVGLTIWDAAYLLSEFILFNSELFHGKDCIELGSGIGLTGVILAAIEPKRLILTDHLIDVLFNLRTNLQLNQFEIQDEISIESKTGLFLSLLDWSNLNEQQAKLYSSEIILAADVVCNLVNLVVKLILYAPELVPIVLNVIRLLLKVSVENGYSKSFALIASRIRNPETYKLFIELSKNDPILLFEDITLTVFKSPKIFPYDRDDQMTVSRFTLKSN